MIFDLLHVPPMLVLPVGQLQQVGRTKPPVQEEHSPVSELKPTHWSQTSIKGDNTLISTQSSHHTRYDVYNSAFCITRYVW